MPTKVFISYRRDDAKYQARMIYDAFRQFVSPDNVFMDVDSIPPGVNFRKILKAWVDECEVLLALIGPGWIDATDPDTGRRRLDNPNDFVRIEISEALSRDIPVVPVLIDGTPMPGSDLLPDDMKELVDRQAEFIEYRTFEADVERMIRNLGFAQAKPQMSTISQPPPQRNEAGKLKNEPPVNNGALHQFDALRRAKEPEQSAETFAERVAQAFPDVQGSTAWFNDAKVIASRLSILFQPPLLLQDGHIWWWRGMDCMHIESFKHIEGSHYLMWPDELNIRRIAVVRPRSYKRTFLYFEMDADEPTKLYPIEHQRDTNWWLENGYLCEEYGLVDGELLVTRCEYDDGAAMIGGSPVDIRGRCKLRVRYTTPYNFLLAPNQSPINSPKEDKRLERYLNQLLLGEDVFEAMCQTIMQLPTKQ